MFYLTLAEDSAKAASRYVRAMSDALAAFGAAATRNATIGPRLAAQMMTAGGPAQGAQAANAEMASEIVSAMMDAQRASFAAQAEFWRAASSWRTAEIATNPFGLTGLFETAHVAPAPLDAAKAEAPAKSKPAAKKAAERDADRTGLLTRPVGEPDDLTRIKGVGPKLSDSLHELGIFHFWQIAALTPGEIEWIDERLKFKGRIEREGWVEQARELMAPAK